MQTKQPRLLSVKPKLLVRDVGVSLAHYRDALGFEVCDRVGEPPTFAILERDKIGVHLKRGEPRTRRAPEDSWDAYFEVQGLEAFHASLVTRGARIIRGPERTEYGMTEIDVVDPDGYVLCFAEEVG